MIGGIVFLAIVAAIMVFFIVLLFRKGPPNSGDYGPGAGGQYGGD